MKIEQDSPLNVAKKLAEDFAVLAGKIILEKGSVDIALSGGSTPELFFKILASDYKNKIEWGRVNFYWVDERCVPPNDDESNYKMTEEILLKNIPVDQNRIHRIRGEEEPEAEAKRYSRLLADNLIIKNGYPQFDVIFLGMGKDGHTASIFPDRMDLISAETYCAVAIQPETKQKRITLTGRVINNAKNIYFLVTGKDKAEIVKEIIEKKDEYKKYPAAHIEPVQGKLSWFIG